MKATPGVFHSETSGWFKITKIYPFVKLVGASRNEEALKG